MKKGAKAVGKTSLISRLTENCLSDEEPFNYKESYICDKTTQSHIIQVLHNNKLYHITFIEVSMFICWPWLLNF